MPGIPSFKEDCAVGYSSTQISEIYFQLQTSWAIFWDSGHPYCSQNYEAVNPPKSKFMGSHLLPHMYWKRRAQI